MIPLNKSLKTSTEIPSYQEEVYSKVIADYFGQDYPIFVDPKTEGQKIRDNKYVIGCKTAYLLCVSSLLHEMAHFAEREINKLKQYPYSSWGFSLGKEWHVGRYSGFEMTTDRDVQREMRCWAFQYSLMRKYNFDFTIEDITSSAHFLNGFLFYHREVRNDKEKLSILAKEVIELSNKYNISAFDKAWNERIIELKKR